MYVARWLNYTVHVRIYMSDEIHFGTKDVTVTNQLCVFESILKIILWWWRLVIGNFIETRNVWQKVTDQS